MKIKIDFITNSSSSSFIAFVVEKDSVFSDDSYEILFKKGLENTKEFYTNHPEYKEEAEEQISKMEAMDKWERKNYVEGEVGFDELLSENSPLEVGGVESEYLGITISTILTHYPDLKVSEISKMVADTINKEFNTYFADEDIKFVEEAWYD